MSTENPRLPDPDDVPPVSAEQLVDGVDGHPGEAPRRYPSTIGGAVFLAALAVVATGLVLAAAGSWRGGVRVVAVALLAAAAVRSLLRPADAGMLAVRHRLVDVVLLSGAGLALLVLVATINDQPG